jgi:hypothetical protein
MAPRQGKRPPESIASQLAKIEARLDPAQWREFLLRVRRAELGELLDHDDGGRQDWLERQEQLEEVPARLLTPPG